MHDNYYFIMIIYYMIIYYMTIIIIILVFIVELESINVCFILKPCAVFQTATRGIYTSLRSS